jgi:hypothetical protein
LQIFRQRFQCIFGRSTPFEIPSGVTESEWFAMSDPDNFDERLVELLGWNLLQKLGCERFFLAGLQEMAGAGTGTLYVLERRAGVILWFRQEYRSPFAGGITPEACYQDLVNTLKVANDLGPDGGSVTFNKGSLTVKPCSAPRAPR